MGGYEWCEVFVDFLDFGCCICGVYCVECVSYVVEKFV